MKTRFNMDTKAYDTFLQGLNEQYFVEKRGNQSDFRLYFDDLWLADTAVIDDVHRSHGAWAVDLIFASIHNPLKFIKRHITTHSCPKRAAQQGEFMRRAAAKDQRGTLSVSVNPLQVCKN
ncbi:hypothetical protein [Dyadobacter sp. 3J3]|uniref:hypothetical protein n=1 Tax=Dyadobacter sp. 3J3 TaxID=2606600 RepID=UPI001359F601|nr:hypothetical protein [Dyadobacter sp. 3J3]